MSRNCEHPTRALGQCSRPAVRCYPLASGPRYLCTQHENGSFGPLAWERIPAINLRRAR